MVQLGMISINMKNKQYNFGGFLQSISPLISLIPGGAPVSAGAGILGSIMNNQTSNNPLPQQMNKNQFGYAMGGELENPGPKPKKKGTLHVFTYNPNVKGTQASNTDKLVVKDYTNWITKNIVTGRPDKYVPLDSLNRNDLSYVSDPNYYWDAISNIRDRNIDAATWNKEYEENIKKFKLQDYLDANGVMDWTKVPESKYNEYYAHKREQSKKWFKDNPEARNKYAYQPAADYKEFLDTRAQDTKSSTFKDEFERGKSTLQSMYDNVVPHHITSTEEFKKAYNQIPEGQSVMWMDHSGSKYFGMPDKEFVKFIASKNPVECIGGSCMGSAAKALRNYVKPTTKIYGAQPGELWEGFNNSKKGLDAIFPAGYQAYQLGGCLDCGQSIPQMAQGGHLNSIGLGGRLDPPKKKKPITYSGGTLPTFTVVANKKNRTSSDITDHTYNRLYEMQQRQTGRMDISREELSKNNFYYNSPYLTWVTAGKPNIVSDSNGRPHYNAEDKTVHLDKTTWIAEDDLLSELPHSLQHEAMGDTFYPTAVKELHKYGDKERYNTKGSLEYQAHKEIEPLVRKHWEENKHKSRMFKFANGGYLDRVSLNTDEVVGNNPTKTDDVTIPGAKVNHGETISNLGPNQKYVFSDTLINPLSGNTFAQDDKRIAQSDSAASKKYNDAEAKNTLTINNRMRQTLASINDSVRAMAQIKQMSDSKEGFWPPHTGSKSKSSDKLYEKEMGGMIKYDNGGPYPLPWNNFNVADFRKYAGLKEGDKFDKATYDALMGDMGRKYALNMGYIFDDNTKSYISSSGYSTPDIGTPDLSMLLQQNRRDQNPLFKEARIKAPDALPLLPTPQVKSMSNTSIESVADELFSGIQDTKSNFLKDNLGTGLQLAELLSKGISTLKRPETQNLYTNNAPISATQYDPSQALMSNAYSFNNLKSSINNLVGEGYKMSNLQQGFSNKYRADADVLSKYSDMNKQAQRDYEARLAQRQSENNQYRYNTDIINSQNKAARNNALRGMFTDVGNFGRALNDQKMNTQATQWLLQAFPDIQQYFSKLKKQHVE